MLSSRKPAYFVMIKLGIVSKEYGHGNLLVTRRIDLYIFICAILERLDPRCVTWRVLYINDRKYCRSIYYVKFKYVMLR